MILKNLCETDFVNYKEPAMFIGTSKCSFKCEKDCGFTCCQNSALAKAAVIEISNKKLIDKYLNNSLTSAIVIGGLEPFDTFEDTFEFIKDFRKVSNDACVIYTGYNFDEIKDQVTQLKSLPNIIVKFGRFIPGTESHFDEILGVQLASPNQYAEKIS